MRKNLPLIHQATYLLIIFLLPLFWYISNQAHAAPTLPKKEEVPALPSQPLVTNNPPSVLPSAATKERSRWAIFAEIGPGAEFIPPIPVIGVHKDDPAGRNSTTYEIDRLGFPYGVFTLPIQVGGSYYVIDSCQKNQASSCVDLLASGSFQYQYLFYDNPTSSIQLQLTLGTDVFFRSQRIVAWTSRFGAGYAYFTYSELVSAASSNHTDKDAYYPGPRNWGYDVASSLQNRLVLSLATGILVNIPPVKGLSLYALFGISATMAISPWMGHNSLQMVYPTLGVRYRF